jgi:hypothetical protein
MKRFLLWLSIAFLILPDIAGAQSAALRHILRYKRGGVVSINCTYPGTIAARFSAYDKAYLFKDTAGTIPVTADGDPVGRWVDRNGSGFYVQSAADDGTRPTYREVSGYAYVSFDGTDDILRRTSATIGIFAAGAGTAVAAIKHDASQLGIFYGEGSSSSDNPLYMLLRNLSADFNDMNAFIRSDGSSSLMANTTLIYDESYPAATNAVVAMTDSGSQIQGWFDGTSASAVAYALTRAGNPLTLNTSGVGGLYRNSGPTAFVKADIYDLVLYASVLSSPNMATATTCAAAQQGRVL